MTDKTILTPEQVRAIRERAEKATPGPWTADKPPRDNDGWSLAVIIAAVARGQGIYAIPPGGSYPAADQNFIAAARTDVPALCATVEALRGLLGEARSYITPIQNEYAPIYARIDAALGKQEDEI
jgi:hypothetical protein